MKIKSIILASIGMLCMMHNALAADTRFVFDGLTYIVTSETEKTVSLGRKMTTSDNLDNYGMPDMVIPDQVTYEGTTYTVTGITDGAFMYSTVESVSIPQHVNFAVSPFYASSKLEKVTIDSRNPYICVKDGSIYSCDGKTFFYAIRGMVSCKIREGVEVIGKYAFYDVSRTLSEVVLPKSLRVIGQSAFANCHKVQELILPEGLERIETCGLAFCGIKHVDFPSTLNELVCDAFECSALEEVFIPKTLRSLGRRPFRECNHLKSIEVEEGHEYYCAIDNVLYTLNRKTQLPSKVVCCANLKEGEMILDEHIYGIEDYAFFGVANITKIVIPEGLTSIDHACFGSMTSLEEIWVYADVNNLRVYNPSRTWFSGCNNLKAVYVPYGSTDFFAEKWGDANYVEMEPKEEPKTSLPLNPVAGEDGNSATHDLMGRPASANHKGLAIRSRRLVR